MTRWLAVFLGAVLVARPAAAQEMVGIATELDRYVRLLELDGQAVGMPLVFRSATLRPRDRGLQVDSTHPWAAWYPLNRSTPATGAKPFSVVPLDLAANGSFNSAYPRTLNDGAQWAGKWVSTALSAGAVMRWGPATAIVNPTLVYAQNAAIVLAPVPFTSRSSFAYPWNSDIDWPQRMGPNATARLDWGQSSARVDWRALTVGLTNESLWWGPAYRNAIIMSNTAPGFPHVDLGTWRPAQTPIGRVEFRALWGGLHESGYFDTTTTNNTRVLSGFTFGYAPSFLPGLTLGFTRVRYETWPAGGLNVGDLFRVYGSPFNPGRKLPDGSVVNDSADQMAAVVARWVLPRAGFEAYVEFARGDFAADLREFLLEPYNTSGLTVGFQKSLAAGNARWRIAGEATRLDRSAQTEVRERHIFYSHSLVPQGYTHRGQLLGAWIGPGSDSQYLGVDRYGRSGRWGAFVQRVRYDNDYFRAAFTGVPLAYLRQQVELTAGGSAMRFVGPLELGAGLELSRFLNRSYVEDNDVTNVKLTVTARLHR